MQSTKKVRPNPKKTLLCLFSCCPRFIRWHKVALILFYLCLATRTMITSTREFRQQTQEKQIKEGSSSGPMSEIIKKIWKMLIHTVQTASIPSALCMQLMQIFVFNFLLDSNGCRRWINECMNEWRCIMHNTAKVFVAENVLKSWRTT